MNYAVEMGSGAMVYIPSFIKTGSGIQKLIGGDTQAQKQYIDLISQLKICCSVQWHAYHAEVHKMC
jgi:hypothetical protein